MDINKLKKGYDMGKMFAKRHKFSGDLALDIGCGHCSQALGFAETFDRVDAIDVVDDVPWKDLLSISANAKKINFFIQDAKHINHLHQKYDLIYSLSAFEHLEDWQVVMANVPNLLEDGGKFYLVISPLYYSPLGHHLDPEIGKWQHILLPEKDLKESFKDKGGPDWKWKEYEQLNRLTVADLLEEARSYFDIKYLKADITSIEMVCEAK